MDTSAENSWQTGTRKDAQHRKPVGKCTLNLNEIPLHTSQNICNCRPALPSAGENVEQELSHVASVDAEWHDQWQAIWRFLRKVNIHLPWDPAVPLPGNSTRKMKAYAHTEHMNADSGFICNSSTVKII